MLDRALGRKCVYAAGALLAVGCAKLNDEPAKSTSSSELEPWPLFNGAKLADALTSPGSKCGAQSDLDYDPSGQPGWYFYLNFTATATTYKD